MLLILLHVLRITQVLVKVQHLSVLGKAEHLVLHVLCALGNKEDGILPVIVEVVTINQLKQGHQLLVMLGYCKGAGGHHSSKDTVQTSSSATDKLNKVVRESERQVALRLHVFLLERLEVDCLLLSLSDITLDIAVFQELNQLRIVEGEETRGLRD